MNKLALKKKSLLYMIIGLGLVILTVVLFVGQLTIGAFNDLFVNWDTPTWLDDFVSNNQWILDPLFDPFGSNNLLSVVLLFLLFFLGLVIVLKNAVKIKGQLGK